MAAYNPALYNDDEDEYYDLKRSPPRATLRARKKKITFGPVQYQPHYQECGVHSKTSRFFADFLQVATTT